MARQIIRIPGAPGTSHHGHATEPELFFGTYSLCLLLVACCIIVYLKNYWLAEDAYINFRSLDQLWHGHGPVWNSGERVQVYTSALWYWLVAGMRFIVHDLYWDVFACSFLLYLLTIGRIIFSYRHFPIVCCAIVLLLLTSNSFMDFAASGLENVLLYFLVTFFFFWFSNRPDNIHGSISPYLWCSVILVARHDELMLLLPFLTVTLIGDLKIQGWWRTLRIASIGMLPLLVWTLFSLVYYGFPFPNTAYAKLNTGIPESELMARGLDYFKITSKYYDPLLPFVLVAGVVTGLINQKTRTLSLGIVLTLLYIVYVGGDYMRGRFFCHLYLLSVLILFYGLERCKQIARIIAASLMIFGCVIWNMAATFTPVTTDLSFSDYAKVEDTSNERGIFYHATSIPAIVASKVAGHPFPDWPFYTEGLALEYSGKPWIYITNIGMTGYGAGLDLHIFDRLALADPLLARLPAIPGPWTPGHFVRDMPWGYPEANLDGVSHIYDTDLDKYYHILRIITKSPELFSLQRMRAIWIANFSPSFGDLRISHIERWSQRGCRICKGENTPSAQK